MRLLIVVLLLTFTGFSAYNWWQAEQLRADVRRLSSAVESMGGGPSPATADASLDGLVGELGRVREAIAAGDLPKARAELDAARKRLDSAARSADKTARPAVDWLRRQAGELAEQVERGR